MISRKGEVARSNQSLIWPGDDVNDTLESKIRSFQRSRYGRSCGPREMRNGQVRLGVTPYEEATERESSD